MVIFNQSIHLSVYLSIYYPIYLIAETYLNLELSAGQGWRENRASVRNFKQAMGLITESVVTYLTLSDDKG